MRYLLATLFIVFLSCASKPKKCERNRTIMFIGAGNYKQCLD